MMGPTGPQAINQVHRRFLPRNAEHDRQVEIVVKDYDHDPSLQYNLVSLTDIWRMGHIWASISSTWARSPSLEATDTAQCLLTFDMPQLLCMKRKMMRCPKFSIVCFLGHHKPAHQRQIRLRIWISHAAAAGSAQEAKCAKKTAFQRASVISEWMRWEASRLLAAKIHGMLLQLHMTREFWSHLNIQLHT